MVHFFDPHNWETVISSGSDWLIILSLVTIECLLSVDNAVVLAAQTQALPTKVQREKSLFYGLWGAYLFRFLIIGAGTYLIHFWEIKVIGSLYLFYLVYQFFGRRKLSEPKSWPARRSTAFRFSGQSLLKLNLWTLFSRLTPSWLHWQFHRTQ